MGNRYGGLYARGQVPTGRMRIQSPPIIIRRPDCSYELEDRQIAREMTEDTSDDAAVIQGVEGLAGQAEESSTTQEAHGLTQSVHKLAEVAMDAVNKLPLARWIGKLL